MYSTLQGNENTLLHSSSHNLNHSPEKTDSSKENPGSRALRHGTRYATLRGSRAYINPNNGIDRYHYTPGEQMQKSTTAQATLAHEQSEKLQNKLSELTTKLDEVTQVMNEQQFELTNGTKVREDQVDNNMKKFERADGGQIETDKVDQTRDIHVQQNQTATII